MNNKSKIFCIGLHKTGTSSLLQAFLKLGIRTCDGLAGADIHERSAFAADPEPLCWLKGLLNDYQAFEDVPWPALYKELQTEFPDAYFILTTRSEQAWINSCVAHFGTQAEPLHEWIYGSGMGAPSGNEEAWTSYFNRHNHDVINYFQALPSTRFLHIRIDDGSSPQEVSDRLRAFLGLPLGECVWSKANSKNRRGSPRNTFIKLLRRVKYSVIGKKSLQFFGLTLTRDYSGLMEPTSRGR